MASRDIESPSNTECPERDDIHLMPKKELSMSSLILWNIKKVFEISSAIDLKNAIQLTSEHLERESYDVQSLKSQKPEEQHLACAILAWQRLGHNRAESLYKFIELNRSEASSSKRKPANLKGVSFKANNYEHHEFAECSKGVFNTSSLIGPVVRLPVETKIVMHMENTCERHQPKKPQKNQTDIKNKIDACCMDSACIKRLTELDSATGELRKRAARLARREAERVELLERAEAAWKDLEVGYQRRLALAEEKEEDITKQIKKFIEDRNAYKNATNVLVQKLKERGVMAEKERERLTQIEKEVCNRACERLRLSEQAAQGDAAVAEQQCRATQLDRDLLYKEEQARRKVLSLENEVDSIRGLTLEAERAMRSELSALKDQMTAVSKQLLGEEATNNNIKTELEEMRQEKMNIIEDLDGCKELCDGNFQKKIDELKNKRDQLNELKNRVIECQCKLPMDVAVEVKRTPSLAALCHCAPEDKVLDSCSCMSLRSQLLSNLLSDLFSGLQSELGGTGSQMPCQLLKCLEDRHNWDRTSLVKTNLRNFFAQLLVGELDIAIATSIEKYHAKWIGASCADQLRSICDPCEEDNEGWQERAIERRAQTLAAELAEKLFKERADMVTQKAKDIMSAGPPPCECKPQQNAAVYPCLIKTPNVSNTMRKSHDGPSSYLKRTIQDVTNIKSQIEDLKKESIKKEDLRQMEDKLAKIIQRVSKQDSKKATIKIDKDDQKLSEDSRIKNTNKNVLSPKKSKKLQIYNQNGRIEKLTNKLTNKKKEPSLAVNLCLCADQNEEVSKIKNAFNSLPKSSWKPNLFTDLTDQISNVKLSNPIVPLPSPHNTNIEKKYRHKPCSSKCICLHKMPSNTSIDRLLEALKNWKSNLDECPVSSKVDGEGQNKLLEDPLEKNLEQLNDDKKFMNKQTFDIIQNSTVYGNDFEKDVMDQKTNECNMPFTTISEYIAGVNLDKSNENFCKCFTCIDPENDTKIKQSDVNNSPSQFKCINTNLCTCKGLNDKYIKQKPSEKESKICSVKVVSDENVKFNKKNQNGVQNDSFIDKIVKESQLFSIGCDYDIKFLGATLTNLKNNKEQLKRFHTNLTTENKQFNDIPNKLSNSDSIIDTNLKSHAKYDKTDEENIILEPKKESCICCKNNEEPKDLEFNAFHLLEDYLREKIDRFKNVSCKSFCIQPQDEQILYSTILNKVKELIAMNTEQFSCKCLQETKADGGWSQVYGLLQEYLRMKMQRVRCSCLNSEEKKTEDLILPNVLEEVTNLIDNDFKRLKDLCVCNTTFKRNESSVEVNKNKTCVHFSDSKSIQLEGIDNSVQCTKKFSSTSMNVEVVNKSCSAIDSIPVNVEMVEKITSCELNTLYVTDCDCRYTFTEPCFLGGDIGVNQNTETYHESISNIDTETKTSTSSKGLHSNFEQKIPYIGYTLNCTCDHNIGCVCTKSLIETNDDKINFIWNSLTNKVYSKKLSYIMHAVPPKVKSNPNDFADNFLNLYISNTSTRDQNKEEIYFDVHEEEPLFAGSTDYCQTQTSLNEDGIVLKDSAEVLNTTSNNTNTDEFPINKQFNDAGSTSHSSFVTAPNAYDEQDIVTNKNTLYNSLFLPAVDDCVGSMKSDVFENSDTTISKSLSQSCDCNMVPICHVKMLVENIEHNLKYSKCTCDSMSSQVCPIHSKKIVVEVKE